ncbi:ComF family protein, partial [Xanthovirga aplysinae]|uniref:ComF family protein n=1 Tax=Xanthovirga aplysinae TaxID=2529853 RepID=UPI001CA43AEC
KGEEHLCTLCRIDLPKVKMSKVGNYYLASRFYGKIDLRYTLAYMKFVKGGVSQQIIHQLKYKNRQEVGEVLGNWFAQELLEKGFEGQFDLVIPVPLSAKKLKKRGYNQSVGFARVLASRLHSECSLEVLERVKDSSSQTIKSRLERWNNVSEVFQLRDGVELFDRNVLLVDDVLTTGSTLEACALRLIEHGCKSLSIAVMACAD